MSKTSNHLGHNGSMTVMGTLDYRDKEILQLMLAEMANREIADRLQIPLSTVQRRTCRLFEKSIVKSRVGLDYEKLSLRRVLLHVYMGDGDIQVSAKKVASIKGMQTTCIRIGNSDVLGFFVFQDAAQLLNIMNQAKKTEGVDHVVWSEEVFALHAPERSMESIFASSPAIAESKNVVNS